MTTTPSIPSRRRWPTDAARRAAKVRSGLVWASLATAVALGSHLAGGGSMPGPLGLLVPWTASLWLCTLVAGRRLPWVRLGLAVSGSQVAFHYLFGLGSGAPMSGHAAHGADLTPVPGHALDHGDPRMWWWHAVGALLTVMLMRGGARLLDHVRRTGLALLAWVGRPRRLPGPVVFAPRLPALVDSASRTWIRVTWYPAATPRRGPPWLLQA